jgi:hypothetical protein
MFVISLASLLRFSFTAPAFSVFSIVITGLDPVIHGAAARWMPGSSPGMTVGEAATLRT